VDDADGAHLLAGGELAVVEADLVGLERVDVDSEDVVLLGLVAKDEVGPFCLLDDELRYLPPLRRVLLPQQVFYRV
jgi:hypothetical protein